MTFIVFVLNGGVYMTEEKFVKTYCRPCGSQRCTGPGDEMAEGCPHYRDLILQNGFVSEENNNKQVKCMNVREIDKEICKLQAMRREAHETERKHQQELARQFVGKCYRNTKGIALKIVSIPQTRLTMTDAIYDANYFPAVFLNYPNKISETCIHDELFEFAPCYCDTVLFYQWNKDFNKDRYDGLTEISQEEFELEFDKCIKNFKRLMKNES